MMTTRLFCTVIEICGRKDIGVTSLIFLVSRDVIGHVTVGSFYPKYPALEPNTEWIQMLGC